MVASVIDISFVTGDQALARGESIAVPLHLRNAPTKLMRDLNYGKDYQYAHDIEGNVAGMDCLPKAYATAATTTQQGAAVKNARLAQFALMALVCLNVSFGHAQSGLVMTIQTRSTTFEAGKPVLMQITYVNRVQEIVWVSKSAIPTVRSGIVVTTKDGERLKGNHETANPARLDRMGFGLHPGETTHESIDIARIYDLTQPGAYTVFVEKVYAPGGHHIKSNAITFTIVK